MPMEIFSELSDLKGIEYVVLQKNEPTDFIMEERNLGQAYLLQIIESISFLLVLL